MNSSELVTTRSVLLDLNRHLRPTALEERAGGTRDLLRYAPPNISVLVEAVSRAAVSIEIRDERIRRLEEQQQEADDLIERMKTKLNEVLRLLHATDAKAKVEMERADRAETDVTHLKSRVDDLESDLAAALADLQRVADVITGSLLSAVQR